jgi:hypothetical protein
LGFGDKVKRKPLDKESLEEKKKEKKTKHWNSSMTWGDKLWVPASSL